MAKKQRPGRRGPVIYGIAALVLALCAAALVLAAVCLRTNSSAFLRLEVAGFRISREEYLRAMYQARNDVLSDHAAAGISLTDWSAETPLGDPTRLVTERALEILTEYYAVSTLAVERGYLADAGYEAMKRDMEEVNRKRQAAIEAGQVVTGLPAFTVEDYLTYRASNIRQQFCADPENPAYQVTRKEIQERHEEDRDALYWKPDAMELAFVLVDDGALAPEFEALRQRAVELGSLEAAIEEDSRLADCFEKISVTPGTYSVYARSHADVLDWAGDLQAGEISPVIRREDRLCLVECLDRTANQYAPLEEVESIVVQSIRESRYDALIGQRMEEMEIQGDLDELYRFTAEQLP